MKRNVIRFLVLALVGFAVARAWSRHVRDRDFALAPERLRDCIDRFSEPYLGYVVDDEKTQAAVWGASRVGLCDLEVETSESMWTTAGPHELQRSGVATAAFIDKELWLASSGRLEHLGFGPPAGLDGPMHVWEDPPMRLAFATPVKLERDGETVKVTDAKGHVVRLPLPH